VTLSVSSDDFIEGKFTCRKLSSQ